jgi:hypothetical protein
MLAQEKVRHECAPYELLWMVREITHPTARYCSLLLAAKSDGNNSLKSSTVCFIVSKPNFH